MLNFLDTFSMGITTRLYKGELASPSWYTSLFTTHLTHSFLVPLLT